MRTIYGFAAVFGLLVALLVIDPWSYESDSLSVVMDEEVLTLRWKGDVDAPMSKVVAKALADRPEAVTTVRFELDSPGGSVVEGERVIGALDAVAAQTRLVTHVGADDLCASMCVPIYLAGEVRTAAPGALFAFHDAFAADAISGAELPQGGRDRQSAARLFRKQFMRPEVDEAWARELRRLIDNEGDVWRTGAELYEERSGIVTRRPRPTE